MNRLTMVAVTLAFAALGAACKKGDANKDPGASASAKASAGAEAAPGTPKESPPPSGTKITRKSPTVGTKRTEDSKSEMAMKLTMAGKVNDMLMTESSTHDDEILEVANDAIMKVKVTFTEDAKSMAEGGKAAKAKPSAIAGKTYVVASKGGKIVVLNDKDKPAPKPEAALVEKQFKALGKPDPMLMAMPERALKENEEVPELSGALIQAMKDHDAKATIEGAKVTFRKKDGDNALFDVAVTVKSGEGPFKMSVPLSGTFALRTVDAWPLKLELSGPLAFELTEKDKKAGVEGGGTLKLTSSYAYK